jgi:type I restriction enzyme S subunit
MNHKIGIPQVRFQEFSGDWTSSMLKTGIDLISGQHLTPTEYNTAGRGTPYFTGPSDFTQYEKGVTKWTEFSTHFGCIDDVLITVKGNGVGKMTLQKLKKVAMGRQLMSIRSKKYDSEFIYHFLLTKLSFLVALASGNLIPGLSRQDILTLKINIPTLSEQQKIASFLSVVDEKIQQLSRKKELLKQYKKGVMQQLFSGKLRFKNENGNDYADWEEKKLGEVATKKSSNISANKIEENFGDFIIYGASGVLKKVDFYKEEKDYISIVKDGAGVGRLLYCKGKSSVLGTMEIISPKQNIDTYFLYCLLSNIDFVKYVTGSTIPHIYFKDYSGELCGIPSLSEQQKIANFLSSIDAKIENTNQQITQTQSFKKGLLQQLFV